MKTTQTQKTKFRHNYFSYFLIASFFFQSIQVSNASAIVKALVSIVDSALNVVFGVVGAVVGTVSALMSGDSLLAGWNCGYYSGSGNRFFGGETCVNEAAGSEASVYVCSSDAKTVTKLTEKFRCPSVKVYCQNGDILSYSPDMGEAKVFCKPTATLEIKEVR